MPTIQRYGFIPGPDSMPVILVFDVSGVNPKWHLLRQTAMGIADAVKEKTHARCIQEDILTLSFSGGRCWENELEYAFAPSVQGRLKKEGLVQSKVEPALDKLAEMLQVSAWMRTKKDTMWMPNIIFLSDGHFTDRRSRIEDSLDVLRQNFWYCHAGKIAVALGENADDDMLELLVGGPQNVVKSDSPDEIKERLHFEKVPAELTYREDIEPCILEDSGW